MLITTAMGSRGTGRQCVACGKTGHTVTTCTSKAAHIIRDLKEKLKAKRVGQLRKPQARKTPKRNGQHQKRARAQYTKKAQAERRKAARRLNAKSRAGKGIIGMVGGDNIVALKKLQEAGYVRKLSCCPACEHGALSEPAARGSRGAIYVRCTSNSCNVRTNVMKESAFSGTKLSPVQVAAIVHGYTDADKIKPPSVDDLAGTAEAGRWATGKIVETLRRAEVKVAQEQNCRGQVKGDLELDGHGLRSFHVSPRNAKFHKYCSKKLLKSKHKYFLTYIRVLGLRKRGGGRLFIHMLPPVCLPPKSKPPPESEAEVMQSGLLKRAKKGSAVVHSDGALGIKSALEKTKRVKHRSVAHKNMEFVRRIKPAIKGGSSLSGTQAIDSTWKVLNKFVPSELNTKKDHEMHPLITEYVWSWAYRLNLRNANGFKTLGAHVKKMF